MSYWKVKITAKFSDGILLEADTKKQAIEDALDAFEEMYDLRMAEFDVPQVWDRLDVVSAKKEK